MHALAKYLPEFGWECVILTTAIPGNPDKLFKIIQTDYTDVIQVWKRRLGLKPNEDAKKKLNISTTKNKRSLIDIILTYLVEIISYPDDRKGWKSFATNGAEDYFKHQRVDILLSSSAPVTSHFIAKDLKKKYKIPWVADLRDLWSDNHYFILTHGPLIHWFRRRLEKKTLKSADAIVTVSPKWVDKLKVLHPNQKIMSITNGYDPDFLAGKSKPLTTKFTITYTGSIYTGAQDPSKLFVVLRDLITEGSLNQSDVEVRFYGPNVEWLESEIQLNKLSDIVKQCGPISREESYKKQQESQILLLLNWEDKRETGWYPLKIFEYLAASRPILAIGGSGKDETKSLIDETCAGVYAANSDDIKTSIKLFYNEYKNNGKVEYKGIAYQIEKYSNKEMARKFAELMDSLIK
jgi:glycosyltransferase involved in cell wall biosynthesis